MAVFMDIGVNSYKEILEVLIWLVGCFALVLATYSYYVSRKQLNFAVIVSCTERFQKIMPKLKDADPTAIRQYIDLCNEELFYFKHGYLPKEIIDEWLDGMVYYLPHFKETPNLNPKFDFLISHDSLVLLDYPRIRHIFNLPKEYKINDTNERRRLVVEIKKRLFDDSY